MALQMAAEPAQGLEIVPREIARPGETGVERRRRVPLGEHEPVAVLPARVTRVVPHLVKIEDGQHVDRRQAASGVPGAGEIQHLEDVHAQVPGGFGKVLDSLVVQHQAGTPNKLLKNSGFQAEQKCPDARRTKSEGKWRTCKVRR
jgi:hypothetical protein